MTFDKITFQAKLGSVLKDKHLITDCHPSQINTIDEAWAEYNRLKHLAHHEVNQGCRFHLLGNDDNARRSFAYAWQQRSVCDWFFTTLKPHPRGPHAPPDASHSHMMKTLEDALRALCADEHGHPRAACSKETYQKYSLKFD